MLPLNRGLYIEQPEKEESYRHADEFYLGDLPQGAPATEPGKGAMMSGKPKGTTDWKSNEPWFGFNGRKRDNHSTYSPIRKNLVSSTKYAIKNHGGKIIEKNGRMMQRKGYWLRYTCRKARECHIVAGPANTFDRGRIPRHIRTHHAWMHRS